MSEEISKKEPDPADTGSSGSDAGEARQEARQSGPTFTEGSDPLAGVRSGFASILDSMEGKTVSMKVYVGTIIGVVVLMMLARCGG